MLKGYIICSGGHYKIPQTGSLGKSQKFIFSQFWWLIPRDQGTGRFGSFGGLSSWFAGSHPPTVSPHDLCLWVSLPGVLSLLVRTSVILDWSATLTTSLTFNYPSSDPVSKYHHIGDSGLRHTSLGGRRGHSIAPNRNHFAQKTFSLSLNSKMINDTMKMTRENQA